MTAVQCDKAPDSESKQVREEAIIRPGVAEVTANCELSEVKFKSSFKKKRRQEDKRGRRV